MSAEQVMDTQESRIEIRVAGILDISKIAAWIIEEKIDFSNGIDEFTPADYSAIKDTLFQALGPENAGVVWVVEFTDKEGQENLVGILMVTANKPWWSSSTILTNSLFYVKPDFRSFNLANKLLEQAIEVIKHLPFPFVVNTVQFTDKVNILEKYFERKGFEKLGSTLVYTGG